MSKVAIVTGAAKGLGKAFTECLLKRGVQVCLSDVDTVQGQQTTQQMQEKYGTPQAVFIKCDTTSQADMEELFRKTKSHFGGIDLVVNNAGIMHEKHWEMMIAVNLMGVIRGTLLGIEHMRKDKGGRGGQVINIASSAGLFPTPWAPAYSASKHGVVAYTTSWAMNPESRKHGVRHNCLCPFFVKTEMLKGISEGQIQHQKIAQKTLDFLGIMDIGDVVAAFETLLDEDKNGTVIQISRLGQKHIDTPKTGLEDFNSKSKL